MTRPLVKRGESGASFVIALVFALLVGFVATVVITSASVNAERASASNRADDQAYYAVVSALDAAGDLVGRDVCTTAGSAFSVSVAADKTATANDMSNDVLGLKAWARDQVQAIAADGSAQPKHVSVKAEDMGAADVPDVLVTFTMNGSGIYARACVDVWGAGAVPSDDAVLKADLVERADYASYFTKQVASGTPLSGSLPLTVSWTAVGASAPDGGEGGA